jgi:hypothetical protein
MSATEIIGIVTITLSMLTGFIYFLKLIQAWMLHRTLRDAIKRDSAIAADLVERIDRSDWPDGGRQRLGSDDRNGLVLIAIGFAVLGYALVVDDPGWVRHAIGGSLFPVLVGLALLARHFWLSRVLEREIAAGA